MEAGLAIRSTIHGHLRRPARWQRVCATLTDEEVSWCRPRSVEAARTTEEGGLRDDGDLFLYDYSTSAARQLTKTADAEQNPRVFTAG